jgi:hypothetical protein
MEPATPFPAATEVAGSPRPLELDTSMTLRVEGRGALFESIEFHHQDGHRS